MRQIRENGLWLLLLGLAVSMLYGQFLGNPFLFDDLPFFVDEMNGRPAINEHQYSPLDLRSLPYATFVWSKAIFGSGLRHFRIENMLLHVAVVWTLYFFLLRLFDAVYGSRTPTQLSLRATAFLAALLFALHPVAIYAVGYLIQRTILMATLFSLLAMYAYLRGSIQGGRYWIWSSVLFYYLAVYSKEHAIMLPAVLLALTVILHEDWRKSIFAQRRAFIAFAVIALFAFAANRGLLGAVYEIYAPEMIDVESNLSYPLSVLTQSWLFFKYVLLWLMPNPRWMSADMREPFAASLVSLNALAFFAYLAWGAGALALLLKRGRAGLLGFAMLFPWLMFLTEFSVVRIQESFVLYRSYLWAVGACALLPLVLDRFSKQVATLLVVAIAVAMVPISMDRLASFSHPLILWHDAEKLVEQHQDLPGVNRIYFNRGTSYMKLDDYGRAISDFQTAIRLDPNWPFPYLNLAVSQAKNGQLEDAVQTFTQAIQVIESRNRGRTARPYYGRAVTYEAMGKMDLARQDYEMSCRMEKMGCDRLEK